YARAAWEHVHVRGVDAVNRVQLEARGWIGLTGQNVLAVRVLREDADRPLPAYLEPVLGGAANVRGFRAGTAVGDTLMAGSVEMMIPLTSPLRFGRFGVSAFT